MDPYWRLLGHGPGGGLPGRRRHLCLEQVQLGEEEILRGDLLGSPIGLGISDWALPEHLETGEDRPSEVGW